MRRVGFSLLTVAIFLSGVVVSGNLTHLLDTNPHYNASWWKVVFAGVLAVFYSIVAWSLARRKEPRDE